MLLSIDVGSPLASKDRIQLGPLPGKSRWLPNKSGNGSSTNVTTTLYGPKNQSQARRVIPAAESLQSFEGNLSWPGHLVIRARRAVQQGPAIYLNTKIDQCSASSALAQRVLTLPAWLPLATPAQNVALGEPDVSGLVSLQLGALHRK